MILSSWPEKTSCNSKTENACKSMDNDSTTQVSDFEYVNTNPSIQLNIPYKLYQRQMNFEKIDDVITVTILYQHREMFTKCSKVYRIRNHQLVNNTFLHGSVTYCIIGKTSMTILLRL